MKLLVLAIITTHAIGKPHDIWQPTIINGNLAKNSLPYQAFLEIYVNNVRYGHCGGTLISNVWVLTAAHCTVGASTIRITLGAYNAFVLERTQKVLLSDSARIYVHPNYDDTTYYNDISLILLPIRVNFNQYIQPVKLPVPLPSVTTTPTPKTTTQTPDVTTEATITESDLTTDSEASVTSSSSVPNLVLPIPIAKRFINFSEVIVPRIKTRYLQVDPQGSYDTYESRIARSSGWGLTDGFGEQVTDLLNYVDVEVLSNEDCRRYYGNLVLDSTICTSGRQFYGNCVGDSGGPLVYNGTLIGVFSFIVQYCLPGYPSAFGRVSSHLGWINYYLNAVG